jgi:hypothetical protein
MLGKVCLNGGLLVLGDKYISYAKAKEAATKFSREYGDSYTVLKSVSLIEPQEVPVTETMYA